MSRYPYTHAADFVRSIGPHAGISPLLSRSDASRLRSEIAKAIGMDDAELASKLADAHIARVED